MGMRPQCALPLPMGEVPQLANWGGEGPLSHGRCRASSPKGGAKYSLPNSPDVPEKGNAPLPGGRGRPPLRKVRPFVLLFEVMKFIPKGYHNCQLFIVNCQFTKAPYSSNCSPPLPVGVVPSSFLQARVKEE